MDYVSSVVVVVVMYWLTICPVNLMIVYQMSSAAAVVGANIVCGVIGGVIGVGSVTCVRRVTSKIIIIGCSSSSGLLFSLRFCCDNTAAASPS